MGMYLGLDSSTQSLTAVLVDTDTGEFVCEETLSFGEELSQYNCPQGVLAHDDPLVKHSDPLMWVAALDRLFGRMRESGVDFGSVQAISGSGQQHGTVYLNQRFLDPAVWPDDGELVDRIGPLLSRSSSPIWMDSSTSTECSEIMTTLGGADAVRTTTGSPAIERFSGPQIRKFWKATPSDYERTAVIHLVSSFMCSLLIGKSAPIDPGDGAGMNLLDLRTGQWSEAMTEATAPDLLPKLPAPVSADTVVGSIAAYFVQRYGFSADTPVVVWSGDNPNSLIGVGGWRPGVMVVSLGTSDTLFAAMSEPRTDPDGCGHVFGNPAGGYMSLICFKNGALAREAVRDQFGLDWHGFEELLNRTPAGNNDNMMLPYFEKPVSRAPARCRD